MKNPSQKLIDQAENKLRKSRAIVVSNYPFFGSLLLNQKLVASTDVQTLATNGSELFFSPDYVMNQTQTLLNFDCAHEALHPGLAHHTRRGERDFGMWNEACDYAINGILQESGLTLPDDCLIRDDLIGQGAEDIYKTLAEERGDDGNESTPPPPVPQPIPPEGDSGDDGPDGQQDDTEGDDGDDGDDGSEGEGSEGDGGGGDSGGQGPVPSFGGAGAVLDAPVESEAERKTEENKWKVTAIQAANLAAAQAGDLPGSLIRQLDALVKPIANWRELLRRYMDQFAMADYSWSKGNRRFLGSGLYLPSLKSEQLPPILFVVDASGSMPKDAFDQAAGELQSILDDLQPEHIDVIVHDTDVCGDAQRFEPGDDLDIKVKAGGGTRFAPVCKWIDEAGDDYAAIIWFTDLETRDWDQCIEPDAPLLWIDYKASEDTDAPFGEEIIPLVDDWT